MTTASEVDADAFTTVGDGPLNLRADWPGSITQCEDQTGGEAESRALDLPAKMDLEL